MATVQQGEGQTSDKSVETFITALVTYSALGAVQFGAFLVLRKKFKNVYEPRYALRPEHGPKQNPLPKGLLAVIPAVLKADDEDIIRHNGLDAYLFVRFNKLMIKFFLPVAVLTWIVLLPVYGTSDGGNSGLNQFTFGNVPSSQTARLAAPLILAWIMTLFLLWLIRQEWLGFITKRRHFLTSKGWATREQAKTVLITGLPKDHANVEAVQSMTNHLEGGVAKIWMARDVDDVSDLYERQMEAAQKLEKADLKVIKQANKKVRKNKVPAEGSSETEKEGSLASRYLPQKKMPSHRLGKIPFIGKKVETIPWAEEEIETTNRELAQARQDPEKYEPVGSAFILFNDQIDAHIFAQKIGEEGQSKKLKLCKRFINVNPQDVVWKNMSRKPSINKVFRILGITATVLLIVFWTVITTFVTGVANVDQLCSTVSFLGWLCSLPTPINGILQGALPPLILIILFALVPIFLRALVKAEGVPLQTQIERHVQRRFFAFLFIQGFIIGTLSAGIVAAISQITQNPSSAPNLLAQNLPGASTFFLTFILTAGFLKSIGALLQVAKLVIYYLKVKFLGSSPRSLQKARYSMPQTDWSTAYPSQLLLAVIALSYSTIAPLVCGFALVAFFLWWFTYKFLALYCWDQTSDTETGGLYFKTALNQLFAGIYIYELCLIGLFFLARNETDGFGALPQAILMVVLLVISVLFQIYLNWKLKPTSEFLDLSLADETRQTERRYAQEMAQSGQNKVRPVDTRATDGTAVDSRNNVNGNGKMQNGIQNNNNINKNDGSLNAGRDVEAGNENLEGMGHQDAEMHGGLDHNAFTHPALWRDQPTVWLARDPLGLSQEAVRRARSRGALITDEDASMDQKGKVEISRETLPGEDFEPNL